VEHEERFEDDRQSIKGDLDELEQQGDELGERSEELGEKVEEGREDFAAKQESPEVPGAQPDDES
jgi:hypothetical protein